MTKQLPFTLQRDSSANLTEQAASGLRRAILTGDFKPGDTLPTLMEMAELLGVSHMVTRGAVRRLKREGLVTARPRAGIVVCDPAVRPWQGQLLHLSWSGSAMYYHNVLSGILAERMQGERILYEHIHLSKAEADAGYPRVRTALASGQWNLALLENSDEGVADLLVTGQVPFVHLTTKGSEVVPNRDATAYLESDRLDACAEAAEHAAACGVREALLVASGTDSPTVRELFVNRGITCPAMVIERDPNLPSPMCIELETLKAFSRYLGKSPRLPGLLVFLDDFVARGALLALVGRGLRIPEDVQVITWANYGLGPLYYEPLTRVEIDGARHGTLIAEFLLQHIHQEKGAPDRLRLEPTFIPGRSTVIVR
jgi:DNA-binding transcriptional regulator YhcF (GntR family)